MRLIPLSTERQVLVYAAPLIRKWNSYPGNVRGSLILIASTLIGSFMAAIVKHVGQNLHVFEILFLRQLMVLAIIAPAILSGFPKVFRTDRFKLHILRAMVSFCAMSTGFTAIINMPLAEATAISFARTLFQTLLAIIILKEIIGIRRWTATLAGFAGVLVIVQPGAEGFNSFAIFALISAGFVAFIMILVRMLAQTERPSTIMAYQSTVLVLMLAGPAIYFWKTPTLTEIGLIVAVGFLMSAMQWTTIQAYRAGEAAAIAPMEYFRLLFTTLIGIYWFTEMPTTTMFFGAGIIVCSTLYTMHRNAVRGKEKHQSKKG